MADAVQVCSTGKNDWRPPVVNSYLHNDSFLLVTPLWCDSELSKGFESSNEVDGSKRIIQLLSVRLGPFCFVPVQWYGLLAERTRRICIQIDANNRCSLVKEKSLSVFVVMRKRLQLTPTEVEGRALLCDDNKALAKTQSQQKKRCGKRRERTHERDSFSLDMIENSRRGSFLWWWIPSPTPSTSLGARRRCQKMPMVPAAGYR